MYEQGSAGFQKMDVESPLLPPLITAASAQAAFSASH
jgi:hypothetical protein